MSQLGVRQQTGQRLLLVAGEQQGDWPSVHLPIEEIRIEGDAGQNNDVDVVASVGDLAGQELSWERQSLKLQL